MGIFAKNYSVEELRKLGLKVEGDPNEIPLFVPEEYQEAREEMGEGKNYTVEELNAMGINVVRGISKEYQEAREEMGEDFIEIEKIDDYIEPDYYHNGTDGVDTIEMLYRTIPFEQFRGFMKGNIIKYVTRYDRKNGPEDLIKAHTYLDKLRDYEERHAAAKRLDERLEEEL